MHGSGLGRGCGGRLRLARPRGGGPRVRPEPDQRDGQARHAARGRGLGPEVSRTRLPGDQHFIAAFRGPAPYKMSHVTAVVPSFISHSSAAIVSLSVVS